MHSLFYFHGKMSSEHQVTISSTITEENKVFFLLLGALRILIFILF